MEKFTVNQLNSVTHIAQELDNGWKICGDVEIRNGLFSQITNGQVFNDEGSAKTTFRYKSAITIVHLDDTDETLQNSLNATVKAFVSDVKEYADENLVTKDTHVPTEEEIEQERQRELANAKQDKMSEIDAYDDSMNVNSFYYNGHPMWIDFDKRKDVRIGVDAMINCGKGEERYELWQDNSLISIQANQLSLMLNVIEVYAVACYAVTANHKYNVSQLTTKEAVASYDYTTGYPEKIVF